MLFCFLLRLYSKFAFIVFTNLSFGFFLLCVYIITHILSYFQYNAKHFLIFFAFFGMFFNFFEIFFDIFSFFANTKSGLQVLTIRFSEHKYL